MGTFDLDGITVRVPETLLTPELTKVLKSGRYEMLERRALRRRLVQGERVMDLGAGIGVTTVEAARVAGASNVTAVEAHPDLIETLEETLNLNGMQDVAIEHVAALPEREAGEVPIYEKNGFWSASLVGEGNERHRVRGIGLWDLIELHRPDVILCDLEGLEASLFLEPLPEAPRLIIVELHPRRYSPRAIQAIFAGLAASGMAYSPKGSRGGVVVFERIDEA